ncbi:MAG TPA: hypothetical protein VGK32_00345 [Vicinamibacterales bacterium]|jgi:hypothetical protein
MMLFLMALSLAMFGLAMTAAAFGAATRTEPTPEVPARPRMELAPERFFAESRAAFHRQPHVPVEVLLLQIEQHVRLEQAAAESFISLPSVDVLNCRTQSPLVH